MNSQETTPDEQIAWIQNAIRASEGNNDNGDVVLGNYEAAAILASLRRLAAAEQNDRRYRWFKSAYSATWLDAVTGSDGVSWSQCWELRIYLPTADDSQLDAAIDSAIAQQVKP